MRKANLAAAILAGGRGERLGGRNKALVDVGGRRMIDHVIASTGPVDMILVCAGPNSFPDDPDLHTVPDLPTSYAGPLAGVGAAVAALAANPPDMLLTVAVDTPFFPVDFVLRASPLLDAHDVVVAAFGEQDYPTNALWRFAVLTQLPESLADGSAPHSLKRLICAMRFQRLDYSGSSKSNPFANANSEAELEALRSTARLQNRG